MNRYSIIVTILVLTASLNITFLPTLGSLFQGSAESSIKLIGLIGTILCLPILSINIWYFRKDRSVFRLVLLILTFIVIVVNTTLLCTSIFGTHDQIPPPFYGCCMNPFSLCAIGADYILSSYICCP